MENDKHRFKKKELLENSQIPGRFFLILFILFHLRSSV
jgi:hypothetical protein